VRDDVTLGQVARRTDPRLGKAAQERHQVATVRREGIGREARLEPQCVEEVRERRAPRRSDRRERILRRRSFLSRESRGLRLFRALALRAWAFRALAFRAFAFRALPVRAFAVRALA